MEITLKRKKYKIMYATLGFEAVIFQVAYVFQKLRVSFKRCVKFLHPNFESKLSKFAMIFQKLRAIFQKLGAAL